MNPVFVLWVTISTPYPEYVFYSEKNDGNNIEIVKKFFPPCIDAGYCFNYNCNNICSNKKNDKSINNLIKFCITYLTMKQGINFVFGGTIHKW